MRCLAQTHHGRLFYQTRLERPELDRAEGIYLWDKSGKRYIDGSSGAMVSNIGHSNPRVLKAMRRQNEVSTFGYRLHFRTEAGETLADKTAAMAPEGVDRVFSFPAVQKPLKAPSSWLANTRSPAVRSSASRSYPARLPTMARRWARWLWRAMAR